MLVVAVVVALTVMVLAEEELGTVTVMTVEQLLDSVTGNTSVLWVIVLDVVTVVDGTTTELASV